jgi:hypothetical protein
MNRLTRFHYLIPQIILHPRFCTAAFSKSCAASVNLFGWLFVKAEGSWCKGATKVWVFDAFTTFGGTPNELVLELRAPLFFRDDALTVELQ